MKCGHSVENLVRVYENGRPTGKRICSVCNAEKLRKEGGVSRRRLIASSSVIISKRNKLKNGFVSEKPIEVEVYEQDDGRRVISFGWPWEYGSYIFRDDAREQPDRVAGRWYLDAGGKGVEVWMEQGEARKVFAWARSLLLAERSVEA
jgi:hypothetical protein